MLLLAPEKVEEKKDKKSEKVVKSIIISSPVDGIAADLSTAPDEAFAQKMMGDGAVVTPQDAIVRAPEDGEVQRSLVAQQSTSLIFFLPPNPLVIASLIESFDVASLLF